MKTTTKCILTIMLFLNLFVNSFAYADSIGIASNGHDIKSKLDTKTPSSHKIALEHFFFRGEYPEETQKTYKDWVLINVFGEEDIDVKPMVYALTRSEDDRSILVFYHRNYRYCQFEVRYLTNGQLENPITVNNLVIDKNKVAVSLASNLVSFLRAGKTAVVSENLPIPQKYSLSGTHKALEKAFKAFSQIPDITCNQW